MDLEIPSIKNMCIDLTIAVTRIVGTIKCNSVITSQVIRHSSFLGSHVYMVKYSKTKEDFIAKLELALANSFEMEYWIDVFYRVCCISEEDYRYLVTLCGNVTKSLIATITVAKCKD